MRDDERVPACDYDLQSISKVSRRRKKTCDGSSSRDGRALCVMQLWQLYVISKTRSEVEASKLHSKTKNEDCVCFQSQKVG
jgi:hypothetical protein